MRRPKWEVLSLPIRVNNVINASSKEPIREAYFREFYDLPFIV